MRRLHWLSFLMLILLALTACRGLATDLSTPTVPPRETRPSKETFTPLPPTATITPRSTGTPTSAPLTPTPTHEAISIIYEDFEITMMTNPQNSSKTDIYVKNLETGEVKLYIALSDIYLEHYHSCEYHNGNLYIIRRIGYSDKEWDSQEWTDELWKYDAYGEGTKLYSVQGLDFRVAPNERYIAQQKDLEHLIFLDSLGNLAREFTINQLTGHDKKAHAPLPAYLSLLKWSDDSSEFWGDLHAGPSPQTIYRIRVPQWQTTTYDVSKLPIYWEYDLNANIAKLAYSDCPAIYDVDGREEFIKSQQQVTLFVYDFSNQSTQVIATAVAKCFNPKWLDDNTIEYNHPGVDDRIMYTLK